MLAMSVKCVVLFPFLNQKSPGLQPPLASSGWADRVGRYETWHVMLSCTGRKMLFSVSLDSKHLDMFTEKRKKRSDRCLLDRFLLHFNVIHNHSQSRERFSQFLLSVSDAVCYSLQFNERSCKRKKLNSGVQTRFNEGKKWTRWLVCLLWGSACSFVRTKETKFCWGFHLGRILGHTSELS